ncbi:MAG: DUF885 domain-containing protein [Betaproteobacteria bacterium]|nr:DUF885 domain-containing protein [Betaproteobacteria bacterium]MBV9362250.1 DUF885 domain-containing protein [Betaproteobacteria bacterium]
MRPLALLLILAGCSAAPTTDMNADQRFQAHAARVLEEVWQEFPELAVRNGNYKYADQLTVPDQARRERSVAFYDRQLAALAQFDRAALNPSNRVDLDILKNRFERNRWYIVTFKPWQWEPSFYNVGPDIDLVLDTEYAPLDTRLRQTLARLANVPAYYTAAKASISDPTAEHIDLALRQNRGAARIFDDGLEKKVESSDLSSEEKALFKQRATAAKAAIDDYIAYLGTLKGTRNFRIGPELYQQKFAYDIQSGFTAEQLYQRALAEKAALHDSMEKRAQELWPKYMAGAPMPADRLVMIRAVLDEMAKHHVARDDFVSAVRKQVPELEAFVRQKDLLDQDPTRPLVVRETPPFMRGSGAGASVSAAGPLNPTANTYYNVTPLDGFTAEQAESYLREYNDWTLQILNIHEAIPGHYTQLMHANKSGSLVKSVFGNGSMIEGWAVFGEKVMMDAGYGGGTPEMWLAWMKWNLRAVLNTVLDYEIQTKDLSRDAAITMMTREAFQQQTEATEKWRRATFTQVQLTSYYNGYAEITALRDEMRAKQGSAFSVKQFNNQFLSYGSAPVRSIRELMLAGQ